MHLISPLEATMGSHGTGGATPKGGQDFLELGGSNDQNHHGSVAGRHRNCCLDYGYSSVAVKITLVFVVIGLSYLVLNQSSYPSQLFQSSDLCSSSSNLSDSEKWSSSPHQFASVDQDDLPSYTKGEINKLESTLKEAAMEDGKTVIITTLNAAWTEPNSIFDLFLESFRIGNHTLHLLDHMVVAALDEAAYARCMAVKVLHCFALTTAGVNFTGEAHFMSEDYLKMMWRRIDFLRVVLQLGFNFIFTDADVMWLRDPFPRFYPKADFQIACDHYDDRLGSTNLGNFPNGGFNYVKSNNKTIKFYKFWYTGKDYFPGKHDQDVLNMIKMDPYVKDLQMEMRFLNTAYFGGFCEASKDLDQVITMHANCCVGLDNKIHDIQMVIDDWKRYMQLGPTGERKSSTRSWTVPRRCGG